MAGAYISHTLFITPPFPVLSVAGVAKHIDWFGPSGDRIEQNSADITVTRNDESSSILTLYKAGTDDAGVYKCVATNGDQQAESTVKVKIFREFRPRSELLIATSGGERREKKVQPIELSVFRCLLKGNAFPPFSFEVRMDFFICSINGRKTIRGPLNDPVCCAALVINGLYFPRMPNISRRPSETKYFPPQTHISLPVGGLNEASAGADTVTRVHRRSG